MNILKWMRSKQVKSETRPVDFHVTLWPSFPHFHRFAVDHRVQGVRLNSAMMAASEIDADFEQAIAKTHVLHHLWFDVKGMQMRIKELVCDETCDHLEFILNRPVKCKTPCTVYFKAGEDKALLKEIKGGTHFIFEGGPKYIVKPGESIHILDKMEVGGPLLLDYEIEKIEKIKSLNFHHWYLSYVYNQRHVDEFREIIEDDELILKIENQAGLKYVANEYQSMPNTRLMAARGDLYVEVPMPHNILKAVKMIVEKDRDAFVGSRMLLSLVHSDVPSCADVCELGWLYEIGYRNFLLCDELCLKEKLLGMATSAFSAFRKEYCESKE